MDRSFVFYESIAKLDPDGYQDLRVWSKNFRKHHLLPDDSSQGIRYDLVNLSRPDELSKKILDLTTVKRLPLTRCYAIVLHTFANVQILKEVIHQLVSRYPRKDAGATGLGHSPSATYSFAYRYNLTLLHVPTRQFIGRTFTSRPEPLLRTAETATPSHYVHSVSFLTEDSSAVAYLSTGIIDPDVAIVAELVCLVRDKKRRGVILGEVGVGFALMDIFGRCDYGRARTSEGLVCGLVPMSACLDPESGVLTVHENMLEEAAVLRGTPRVLLVESVAEAAHGVMKGTQRENTLGVPVGSLRYAVLRHERLEVAVSDERTLLRENDFYCVYDSIPGILPLEIVDPDTRQVTEKVMGLDDPEFEEDLDMRLERLEILLPPRFEERLLDHAEAARRRDQPPDRIIPSESIKVVGTQLLVGVHNSCTFLKPPRTLPLENLQTKRTQTTKNVVRVGFRGSMPFPEFVRNPACAFVFELQYRLSIPEPRRPEQKAPPKGFAKAIASLFTKKKPPKLIDPVPIRKETLVSIAACVYLPLVNDPVEGQFDEHGAPLMSLMQREMAAKLAMVGGRGRAPISGQLMYVCSETLKLHFDVFPDDGGGGEEPEEEEYSVGTPSLDDGLLSPDDSFPVHVEEEVRPLVQAKKKRKIRLYQDITREDMDMIKKGRFEPLEDVTARLTPKQPQGPDTELDLVAAALPSAKLMTHGVSIYGCQFLTYTPNEPVDIPPALIFRLSLLEVVQETQEVTLRASELEVGEPCVLRGDKADGCILSLMFEADKISQQTSLKLKTDLVSTVCEVDVIDVELGEVFGVAEIPLLLFGDRREKAYALSIFDGSRKGRPIAFVSARLWFDSCPPLPKTPAAPLVEPSQVKPKPSATLVEHLGGVLQDAETKRDQKRRLELSRIGDASRTTTVMVSGATTAHPKPFRFSIANLRDSERLLWIDTGCPEISLPVGDSVMASSSRSLLNGNLDKLSQWSYRIRLQPMETGQISGLCSATSPKALQMLVVDHESKERLLTVFVNSS